MKELETLENRIRKEVFLKDYKGQDRVVLAKDKKLQLEEEAKTRPKFSALVPTMPTLNECVDGFRKQQLVVVSGPPKNGKSELCATFTTNFMNQGLKCLWLPFEGMFEELFARFLDKWDFYVPNYMEQGRIEWVEDKIIEAKQKFGTEIIFIDNLDFLCDPSMAKEMRGINSNYATYVGSIVQRVKELAVAHNVLIFLMSHITKTKWTTNKLPDSEDLRDTGKTAQLADIVIMIIRERSKKEDEVYTGNTAIMGVMENRLNGKTKKMRLELSIYKEFMEIPFEKKEESIDIGF